MNKIELCDQIALKFHHIPVAENELPEHESPLAKHVNGGVSIANEICDVLPIMEGDDLNELCELALMNIDPELVEVFGDA